MVTPYAGTEDGSSLSGHERNALFINDGGRSFTNVSGICGADDPADGRAVGLLDYDRDGYTDLAVVNANAPLFQLFRNEIPEATGAPEGSARMLALRFRGANQTQDAAPGRSARDGYGARVEIDLPDATLVREHRAGEGFATQNSATLRVGLGDVAEVAAIRVRWPSGATQELGPVAADSLVTVYEDPAQNPTGSGALRIEPYRKQGLAKAAAARRAARGREGRVLALSTNGQADAPLRVVTTMATWCDTCRGELPQVARLRAAFPEDQVALLAVPVDEDDTKAKLVRYEEENRPAYRLLKDLPESEIESVRRAVIEELRIDALPAALITDREGRVLRALYQVPSVSEVRALLAEVAS